MNPYELQLLQNQQRQQLLQQQLSRSIAPQPGLNNAFTALGQVGSAALLSKALTGEQDSQLQIQAQNQQAQQSALANILGQQGTPDARQNILHAVMAQQQYLPVGMDPMALATALSPQPQKPFSYVGNNQIDPETGEPTGVRLPTEEKDEKPKKTDIMIEAESLFPNDPAKQSNYIQAYRTKPAQTVSVDVSTGDKKQDETVGKWYGDQFARMQERGASAATREATLDRLDKLLEQVAVRGAGADVAQALKRLGLALGFDLESMGIVDDTGAAETATALRNQLVLEMQQPGGPIDIAGALSDRDMQIIQSVMPGIGNTAESTKLIIDAQKRLARRERDVAKLARDYAKKNGGRLDAGFYDELSAWSDQNPLFADLEDTQQRLKAAEKIRADLQANKLTKEQAVGLLRELGMH